MDILGKNKYVKFHPKQWWPLKTKLKKEMKDNRKKAISGCKYNITKA